MRKLYNKIWVDAIVQEQSKKNQNLNWKPYTLVPMSILMGMNLFTLFYWLKAINRNLPLFLPVNIFNAKPINGFISIVVTFVIPFLLLNYLLIFTEDRYKVLLNSYPSRKGELYKKYALITLGLMFIPIILQKLFFQEV